MDTVFDNVPQEEVKPKRRGRKPKEPEPEPEPEPVLMPEQLSSKEAL